MGLRREALSINVITSITVISDIMATTTIAVKMETKEMLRQFGHKGESYDFIIRKLIKKSDMKKLDMKWNTILDKEEFVSLDDL